MTTMAKMRDRVHRRFARAYGACMCAAQRNPLSGYPKTIVTTFYDFEGSYGMADATHRCLTALARIVEIERRYQVRSTYNTVALLARENPDIIKGLHADGHEIASHSYDHTVLASLSPADQLKNIRGAKAIFNELGIRVAGHRSPLSRWNRALMKNLCAEGYAWTAENGGEAHPYVVHRSDRTTLWRFPVITDDWAYESANLPASQMLAHWQAIVNEARRSKRYTAIGFHPWIECNNDRLEVLESYLAWLTSLPDVQVLPFGAVLALINSAQNA
jgi:peptidoglycan/xylan/chitin deacetylase (PgdA/CDA1 family)